MSKRYGFEHLRVYQMAEELADRLWDIVLKWPIFASDTVGKQLVRAADRIGADIAEGTGRGTPKDNRKFVNDARGSLYETRHWLRRAFRRKLLPQKDVAVLQKLVDELSPSLNAYRKALTKRMTSRSS